MFKKGRGEERVGKKFRRKEYSSGIFGDEAGVQRDNRATELQMNEINKIKWSEDYSSFLFFPSFFDPETKVSRAQSKEINLFIAPFDPSTFLEFWKTGARHLRHSIFLLLLSFPCPISSQEDR